MSTFSFEPVRVTRNVLRTLARRPLFAGLSVLLMAFGVGAITAIFTVVNATLLRPLPYVDPTALYSVSGTEPVNRDSAEVMVLSARQLVRWREGTRAFSAFEGYTPGAMKLTGSGLPAPLAGMFVSAGMFDLLGWRPAMGRDFSTAEEVPRSAVAIISHGLWVRRFARDPNIVGRVVNIDDEPRAIIGVMPAGFSMLFQDVDVWRPMDLGPDEIAGRSRLIAGVGRLRAGVTAAQATLDLKSINAELAREFPNDYRFTGVKIVGLRDSLFGPQRANLLVLLAAVAILLTVAAMNVLSLTYADVLGRRFATMTRLALGATKRDIVVLRLIETAVMTAIAAALGIVIGRLGLAALQAASPDAFRGFGVISIDPIVAVAAVGAALFAGIVAGLPAAMSEARIDVAGLAGTAVKGIGGMSERRMRDTLLSAQVVLAVMLLSGAALLTRNVKDLLQRPTGFRPRGVIVVELTLSQTTYTTHEQRAMYVQRLLDAVRALPGIEAASTDQTRFALNETMQTGLEIEGVPTEPGVQQSAQIRHSTPDLLKVLGIRLLRGRAIDAGDRPDGPRVAMVSASFAKHYWGTKNPIGQRVRRASKSNPQWMEVVGVVDDVMDAGLGVDIGPTIYVSYLQQNTPVARVTLLARTRGAAATIYPAIRRAIWSVDANQPIQSITGLEDLLLRSAAQPRFEALVAALFAASALLLVLSGIYATTLYAVLRRTRELGVRAALGARPADLVGATMWHSMRPVALGLAIGSLLAIPLVQTMQDALKQGFSAADAPLFGGVVLVVVAATALAAYFPARRALSIPPSVAMRG
jgi:putative ABC transport system permease protein